MAAECLQKSGRRMQAAELYRQAGYFQDAAEILAELGQYFEAARLTGDANLVEPTIGYLSKVPPDHLHFGEATLGLAKLLRARGDRSRAIGNLERALRSAAVTAANLDLWQMLAELYEETGEPSKAAWVLHNILKVGPNRPWVKQKLQLLVAELEIDTPAARDGESSSSFARRMLSSLTPRLVQAMSSAPAESDPTPA